MSYQRRPDRGLVVVLVSGGGSWGEAPGAANCDKRVLLVCPENFVLYFSIERPFDGWARNDFAFEQAAGHFDLNGAAYLVSVHNNFLI